MGCDFERFGKGVGGKYETINLTFMKYTKEFEQAVKLAKKENLFLGYGNPNGKILMIGKEYAFEHKCEKNTKEFYDEIIKKREEENKNNILSWESNITENFEPDWNPNKQAEILNGNPYIMYWNQRNLQDQKLKNGQWNGGTSNTYLHYQKIYQNVFLNREKQTHINFQKEFFLTEMNDLPSKMSYPFSRLNELRKYFIDKRKPLFELPFFRNFPIIIIASGHYPRDYNFDIQKIFNVKYEKLIEIGNSWYNFHRSTDEKRMVIHTRQLSTSISTELIDALSNKIIKSLDKYPPHHILAYLPFFFASKLN